MRWSFLLAVFGLSVTSVASFAQRPPGDQRPTLDRSASHDDGLFATTGMVRFQLIQGRLGLDPPRHRKGSQQREQNGRYEHLTVTAERGIPSLHYVCKSADQHLTLSVHQAKSIRIESWLTDSDERSVLTQPAHGPITLTIQRGDLNDRYQGPTLIHLRYLDQVDFDRHHGLLIQRMLRGKSLESISRATERITLEQLGNSIAPRLELVREQVEMLRSPRRAARVSAERQLLAWGTPIVSALRTIPKQDLDSEQLARISAIAQRLRPRVEDTPASLAKFLASDRDYWIAIAANLDRNQFQLVGQHLDQLGAEPISLQTKPAERIAAAGD